MIRSVAHTQTRAWRQAHIERYRRTWLIIFGIVGVALILAFLGYFGTVPWSVLLGSVLQTTYRLIFAYAIALILGVAIALLVGSSSLTDALFPIFDILQNIPSFALIPFFIYFLGYTDKMIILFAVSSIIWPILFAVLSAIKSAHTDLSDAATIFGAKGFRRIQFYLAPLSLPSILTGSIVGIAIGWEAVIGAEIIANTSGFGSFIREASTNGINQAAVAGMFMILIIVFIVNRLVWTPLLADSSKRYAE